MMRKIICAIFCMLLICSSIVSIADWDPEDGHKMHWPQLPDPNGWDVYATAGLSQYPWVSVADDWRCSETGYIRDIHFWGSWFGDIVGEIDHFIIGVAANIPPEQNPNGQWSIPGETLVEWEIYDWVERGPYEGNQGWYWSYDEDNPWYPNDHHLYWQYNVFLDDEDWLWQEEGTIYWLFISAIVEENPTGQPLWGWKSTTEDLHFMDDAVWGYWGELYWLPLHYPTGMTMDLAFVIAVADNPDIDIDKKVSNDGGITWSDEVNVEFDDTVRFKITVENTGDVDLNYIKIVDTLPSCLEYADNADPIEPIISGNTLTWIYTYLNVGQIKEIEFDAKAIEPGENINRVTVTTLEEIQASDNATVNVGDIPVPDLDCEGEIRWSSITPGSIVTDTIYVKNVGDPNSNLKWRVCGYPTSWGANWSFSPDHGDNLKPSDGLKAITVTVDAPSQQNQQFTGQIELCNEEDSTDTCTIQVSLATPRNKTFNLQLFLFLQKLSENFPEFEKIIKQIFGIIN